MKTPPTIKFLDRDPPVVPLDELREKLADLYEVSGRWQQLGSECDLNYRLETGGGERYLLKVANSAESPAVIDFQLGALRHIATTAPALPVPRIVPCREGRNSRTLRFSDGAEHSVFLLSYLDGVPLAASDGARDPATRRRFGALLGKLDRALRGYFHPAAVQQHPWNFETCPRLATLLEHIEDRQQRTVVDEALTRMRDVTIPRLYTLRHQVIHQDAHGDNVLVNPQQTTDMTGLIDFGDLLYGTLAAELAVACDGVAKGSDDFVAGACDVVAGFDSEMALETEEIDLLFDLVCARNAMTAVIAAARLALTPEQPAHIDSPLRFVERLHALRRIGRAEYTRRIRAACRFPVFCPRSPDESLPLEDEARLVESRRTLMGRKATHFYARPMHFERASGPWLFATDGRRYLDCYNNVPQLGHCHPHVVRSIARQAATLNTNTRYLYSSAIEYAERLTGKLAPQLTACLFVNSGSEANDVAWQMAKLVTGNTGALIMEDAYHGVTDVIRQFSPGHPDKPLPDFLRGLLVPDPYRGPYRDGDPQLVENYVADADRAISELQESGHGVAAFMIDSALCSSGVPEVPTGYMQGVAARVRAAGGLLIGDEVQSGFGRMGQWWGHEHHGVQPDIVTMGKPVGNGHPLGVVVTTDDILNRFIDRVRLFSTYGGNTVACAAGNAVLDVIEQDNLIERGRHTGEYLRAELRRLAGRHDLIGNVRGYGMVAGLEFVTDRNERSPATDETARLLELMREQQVLVGSEGRDENILKLRPALIFSKEHVDQFIDALDRSLAAL